MSVPSVNMHSVDYQSLRRPERALGATGMGSGTTLPSAAGDSIQVSELARELSVLAGAKEGPELHLSPQELREMVAPPESSTPRGKQQVE